MIAAARESQKVSALTTQVIKTTGGAANISASQIGKLSTALGQKTAIDDEVIQSGANVLLTFTNIRNEAGKGNDVFSQTVATANDMSVALGTSMKSASMQLGKALNDPVAGMTKLTRSGVTFTDQQKKQVAALVKSHDTLGAQKIILGEVNREFGGAAAAAATPFERLKFTIGNLGEAIGGKLLPIIDGASTLIADKLPGWLASAQKGFDNVRTAVTPLGQWIGQRLPGWIVTAKKAFADTLVVIKNVATILGNIAGFIRDNSTLFEVLGAIVVTAAAGWWVYTAALAAWAAVQEGVAAVTRIATGVQVAFNAVMEANPIVLVAIAVAALVAALVVLYIKVPAVRKVIDVALNAMKAIFQTVFPIIVKVVQVAFTVIAKIVTVTFRVMKAIIVTGFRAFRTVFTTGFSVIRSVVTTAWRVIKTSFQTPFKAISALIRDIWSTIRGLFTTSFSTIRSKVRDAWSSIKSIFRDAFSDIREMVSDAFQRVIDVVANIPDRIGRLAGRFERVGRELIKSFISGLANAGDFVSNIAGNIWDALRGMLDAAIRAINSALEFSISLPLGKSITINPPDIPQLASGGIVTQGTLAIVGERGPEAIIPLDRLRAEAGGGDTYYVSVQTSVGQSNAEVGKEIAAYLRAYARVGGNVSLAGGRP